MSTPTGISAVIIALNEEAHLKQCIASLRGLADQVIVVDSGSTDNTLRIAEEMGAQVRTTEWQGYAQTKNWAQDQISGDYVLSIDADEVISNELKESILLAISSGLEGAYSMNRLNNYCGKWMKTAGLYPDTKIRLFPKDIRWEGTVHEVLNTKNIPIHHLKGDLLHYSIVDKQDHVAREKKYAALAQPYESKLVAFFASCFRFIKTYFLQMGVMDGSLGFQYCIITAKSRWWRNSG